MTITFDRAQVSRPQSKWHIARQDSQLVCIWIPLPLLQRKHESTNKQVYENLTLTTTQLAI